MTAQPIGPTAYLPEPNQPTPKPLSASRLHGFAKDLTKAVSADEVSALEDAFGEPNRVAPQTSGRSVTHPVKGRHLDVRA